MGMEYENEGAERVEAVYLWPEIIWQRQDALQKTAVQKGERVLDIASGSGF